MSKIDKKKSVDVEVLPKQKLPEAFGKATDRLAGVVAKVSTDFGIKNESFLKSSAYINRKRFTLLSLRDILSKASDGDIDEISHKLEARMDEIEKEYESFGEGTTRLDEFDAIMVRIELARKAGDLAKAIDLQKEYLANWKDKIPVHERVSVMYWMTQDMMRRVKDYEEVMEFEKITMFKKDLRVGDDILIVADHLGKKIIGEYWKVDHVYVDKGMMVSSDEEKGKFIALADIEKFFTDRLKAHREKDPTFDLGILPRLVKPNNGSERWLGEIAEAMQEMAVMDLEREVLDLNSGVLFGKDAPVLFNGVSIVDGRVLLAPEFLIENADTRKPVLDRLKIYLEREKLKQQIAVETGNMKSLLEIELSFKDGKLAEGRTQCINVLNNLNKIGAENLSADDEMILAKVRGYLKGMWVSYTTRLVNMNHSVFGNEAIKRVRVKKHFQPGQMDVFQTAFQIVRSRNENVLTKVLEGLSDEDLVKDPTKFLADKAMSEAPSSPEFADAVGVCNQTWVEILNAESLFSAGGDSDKKLCLKVANLLREIGQYDVAEDYMARGLKDELTIYRSIDVMKARKMEIEMRLSKDKEKYKEEAKRRFLLQQRGQKFKELPEYVLDQMVLDSISKAADDQIKSMSLLELVKSKNAGLLSGVENDLVESYDQMRDPMDKLFVLSDKEIEDMGDLVIEATLAAILVAFSGGTSFVVGAGIRALVMRLGARRIFGWGAEFFTKVVAFEATHKALEPLLIGGPGFTTVEDFGKSVGSGILMFGALDAGNALVGTLRTLRTARLVAAGKNLSKLETAGFWTTQIATEAGVMTNVATLEQIAGGMNLSDIDTMEMYLRNLKMILELRAGGKLVHPITAPLHEIGVEYKKEVAKAEELKGLKSPLAHLLEIESDVRKKYMAGVEAYRLSMKGVVVNYSGLPFNDIAAGLREVFGLFDSTTVKTKDVAELYDTENFEDISKIKSSLRNIFGFLKATNGRYMGNILHQGVRDHSTNDAHTDGSGVHRDEIYSLMKSGSLMSNVARAFDDPMYLDNASKNVAEIMKTGKTLAEAVDEFIYNERSGSELAGKDGSVDQLAVHFSSNSILDHVYGSETGNEAFVIFPEKSILEGRDYYSRAQDTAFSRDTIYNDVWVWPKGAESNSMHLDGALIFLPRDNQVGIKTGSLYELVDGKVVIDVKKMERVSSLINECNEIIRNNFKNKIENKDSEPLRDVLERMGLTFDEFEKIGSIGLPHSSVVSDRLAIEGLFEGEGLAEIKKYLYMALMDSGPRSSGIGNALIQLPQLSNIKPEFRDVIRNILRDKGFNVELLEKLFEDKKLSSMVVEFLENNINSYKNFATSTKGLFYQKAAETVDSREYHDVRIRSLFQEVTVEEFVGQSQDVVEYRGVGKDGKPKVLRVVYYTGEDPNVAIRRLYNEVGIRFDDTVVDDSNVHGAAAAKARQVGPVDVKYDHDYKRLKQRIVDHMEGRPVEKSQRAEHEDAHVKSRAENAKMLDQLVEFENGMDKEFVDIEDRVERTDRENVFDQDRDVQRIYSGEITPAEYGKMVYEQATRAGELVSAIEAEIANNPHVTLKEIYERFILSEPISKEIAHKLLKSAEFLLRMQKRSSVYETMIQNHLRGSGLSLDMASEKTQDAVAEVLVKMLKIPTLDSVEGGIRINSKDAGGTLMVEVFSQETFRKIMEAAHVDDVCNTHGVVIDIPELGIPILVLNMSSIGYNVDKYDYVVNHEVQHVKKRPTNPMERGAALYVQYFSEFVDGKHNFVVDGMESGSRVNKYFDNYLNQIKTEFKDELLAWFVHGAPKTSIMGSLLRPGSGYDYIERDMRNNNYNFNLQVGRDMSPHGVKNLRATYDEFCNGVINLLFNVEAGLIEKHGMSQKEARKVLRDYLHLVPIEDFRFHLLEFGKEKFGWKVDTGPMERYDYNNADVSKVVDGLKQTLPHYKQSPSEKGLEHEMIGDHFIDGGPSTRDVLNSDKTLFLPTEVFDKFYDGSPDPVTFIGATRAVKEGKMTQSEMDDVLHSQNIAFAQAMSGLGTQLRDDYMGRNNGKDVSVRKLFDDYLDGKGVSKEDGQALLFITQHMKRVAMRSNMIKTLIDNEVVRLISERLGDGNVNADKADDINREVVSKILVQFFGVPPLVGDVGLSISDGVLIFKFYSQVDFVNFYGAGGEHAGGFFRSGSPLGVPIVAVAPGQNVKSVVTHEIQHLWKRMTNDYEPANFNRNVYLMNEFGAGVHVTKNDKLNVKSVRRHLGLELENVQIGLKDEIFAYVLMHDGSGRRGERGSLQSLTEMLVQDNLYRYLNKDSYNYNEIKKNVLFGIGEGNVDKVFGGMSGFDTWFEGQMDNMRKRYDKETLVAITGFCKTRELFMKEKGKSRKEADQFLVDYLTRIPISQWTYYLELFEKKNIFGAEIGPNIERQQRPVTIDKSPDLIDNVGQVKPLRPLVAEGNKKLKRTPMVDDSRGKLDGGDWRQKYDQVSTTTTQGFSRVRIGDKYGIVNESGLEVVPPKFTYIQITNRAAYVYLGEKVGAYHLDTGKELMPPKYDKILHINPDYFLVKMELNGKVGVFDARYGKEAVRPLYDDVLYDGGGIANVKFGDIWQDIKIDVSPIDEAAVESAKVGGAAVEAAKVEEAVRFGARKLDGVDWKAEFDRVGEPNAEGLAWVEVGGQYGLVDVKRGEVALEPKYDVIYEPNEQGFAHVELFGKHGFVNVKSGREVLMPKFDSVKNPNHEGVVEVELGGKIGFVDLKNPQFVVFPTYNSLGEYVWLKLADGGWGIVDVVNGVEVIYDSVEVTEKGSVRALLGDKWIEFYGGDAPLIGEAADVASKVGGARPALSRNAGKSDVVTGVPEWHAKYVEVADLNRDFKKVRLGDKWGVVKNDGEVFVEPKYDEVEKLDSSFFKVRVGDKWGVLRDEGPRESIKPKYDDIVFLNGLYASFRVGDKWGVIDYNFGSVKFDAKYDEVRDGGYDFFIFRDRSKFGVINDGGEYIVDAKYDSIKFNSKIRLNECKIGDNTNYFNEKWVETDSQGKPLWQANYAMVENPNSDYSAVSQGGKWGLVNRYGVGVAELKYDKITPLSNYFIELRIGDKVGFYATYKEGRVVEPKYDEIKVLDSGFLNVREGDKWGVVREGGGYSVSVQYDQIVYLGLLEAKVESGGKWGVIDFNYGSTRIDVIYDSIKVVEETGVYECKTGDKTHYFNANLHRINEDGSSYVEVPNVVVQSDKILDSMTEFYGDDIWAIRTQSGWGLMNAKTSEILLAPKYDSFGDGPRGSFLRPKLGGKEGMIDLDRMVEVVPPEYFRVYPPDNGVITAELSVNFGGEAHYYNMDGKRVTWNGQPLEIGDVSKVGAAKVGDTLEPVVVSKKPNVSAWHSRFDKVGQLWWKRHVVQKGGKFGFVSENGLTVTQPKYDDVRNPHYEFPWVKVGKKWGIVNKFGKEIVPPKYDVVGNVWDDLAVVQNNGKWGYVNTEGVEIVPPRYDAVTDFRNGFAKVMFGKKLYRINVKGEFVYADGAVYESQTFEEAPDVKTPTPKTIEGADWRGNYDKVFEPDANGFMGVMSAGKYGLVDKHGNEVIPTKYKAIFNGDGRVRVVRLFDLKDGKYDDDRFYDLEKGMEISQFEYDFVPTFISSLVRSKVGRVIAGLSLAGAIGIGTVGIRGDSSEFSKPRILDTRGASDKPNVVNTEKVPDEMKPYKAEAVKRYTTITVGNLNEAIEKGYIIETEDGIFPATGLDWKNEDVDLDKPETLTLIKVMK